MIAVINLRSDYEYARIEYAPNMANDKKPYRLMVKYQDRYPFSSDWYKTERGARTHFTKLFQNPKWGKEYPKPIWENI